MKTLRSAWCCTLALSLAVTLADNATCQTRRPQAGRGAIQGRFEWPDSTPIPGWKIKLVDKISVYDVPNIQGFSVQKVAISRNARVWQTTTDAQGRFRIPTLRAGTYYLFFRARGVADHPDDAWLYQYTAPIGVLYLEGHMEKPDAYRVRAGATTTIPDIELVHRLVPKDPVPLPATPGVYRFTWPASDPRFTYRITIEHRDYSGEVKHPSYRANEVGENTYQTPYGKPLHPGKHHFQVEVLTPTENTFARSEWAEFTVPGEVFSLEAASASRDPTMRTMKWTASDAVKCIRILAEDGSVNLTTTDRLVKLPPTRKGRQIKLIPLDARGAELIPGWTVFFWQEAAHPRSRQKQ